VKDASKDNESECIFCVKPGEGDDEAEPDRPSRERCFVILNKFPVLRTDT